MSNYITYILIILVFPVSLISQINSNLIERFLSNQPCKILYWKTINEGYRDSTEKAFIPVLVITQINDSTTEKKYMNFKSNLKNYEIKEGYIRSDTTYFYYIPMSRSKELDFTLLSPDSEKINYLSTDSPFCNSFNEVSSIEASIDLFEADLQTYSIQRLKNSRFMNNAIPFFVVGIGCGFLANEAFTENKKGMEKVGYIAGGTLATAGAIMFTYDSIKGFFQYIGRKKEMKRTRQRLLSTKY